MPAGSREDSCSIWNGNGSEVPKLRSSSYGTTLDSDLQLPACALARLALRGSLRTQDRVPMTV